MKIKKKKKIDFTICEKNCWLLEKVKRYSDGFYSAPKLEVATALQGWSMIAWVSRCPEFSRDPAAFLIPLECGSSSPNVEPSNASHTRGILSGRCCSGLGLDNCHSEEPLLFRRKFPFAIDSDVLPALPE